MAKTGLPDEIPSFWKKFWIKTGIIVALLAAIVLGGTLLYRRWEPARLSSQARVYLEKGDFPNAILTARRALQINPTSKPASQVMAEISAKMQAPEVVDWRQRVSELTPGSAPEALAWAESALQMKRPASAAQALATLPEAERGNARYHSLAGVAAVGAGHPREAEKHFAEAVRLEPSNELHRYNLATLQIQSPDPAVRKAGAATLDELARGGRMEVLAKRIAIQRRREEKAFDEALRLSAELQRNPNAEFVDRIAHLDLLSRLQRPDLLAFLADVQEKARADKPENAAALMHWMRLHGMNPEALCWADSLDPKFAAHGRIGIARAESFIAAKDWTALRELTQKSDWGDLDPVRIAYAARALREQGDLSGSRARWAAALASVSRHRQQVQQLALIASRWDWQPELRETLWLAATFPAPQGTLQMLHRLYLADGDSLGLLRVSQRFAEIDPTSDAARNNVASLSLLLRRDVAQATEIARQLHEKAPANAAFASTWAFALHLSGRTAEGLQVLRALRPEQLREPSVAIYYGVLLAASGAREEAVPFLELSKKAPLLLEERVLAQAAH